MSGNINTTFTNNLSIFEKWRNFGGGVSSHPLLKGGGEGDFQNSEEKTIEKHKKKIFTKFNGD